MEPTLRSGHETARLNGTATGNGTAEFGCREHYAGLRMKEVVIADELRWMTTADGLAGSRTKEAEAAKFADVSELGEIRRTGRSSLQNHGARIT